MLRKVLAPLFLFIPKPTFGKGQYLCCTRVGTIDRGDEDFFYCEEEQGEKSFVSKKSGAKTFSLQHSKIQDFIFQNSHFWRYVGSDESGRNIKGRVKIYRLPGPGASTGGRRVFLKKNRGAPTF